MWVLIGCEESQKICIAFRKRNHEAFSCDYKYPSGRHLEWHLQMDVKKAIYLKKWDLIIVHPPCTRLANSGVQWLNKSDLWDSFYSDVEFFNFFVNIGISGAKLCIENPIQHKYARQMIIKYNQIIQPYQFGHMETKATCLWLFNLPKLKGTNNVYKQMITLSKKLKNRIHYISNSNPEIRKELRSKTYQGIADAMAEQWGKVHLDNIVQKPFFYI